jgi:hypothetical protein
MIEEALKKDFDLMDSVQDKMIHDIAEDELKKIYA